MLKINPEDKRKLKFEVGIQGIDYKLLKGALRFNVDEIEYGFPVEVSKESISVDIPPLGNIIKTLSDRQEINASLQVFGEGFFLEPWIGKFEVEIPIKVEAKIMDDYDKEIVTEKKEAKVQVKSIEEEKEILHEPVDDEDADAEIEEIKESKKKTILTKKNLKKKAKSIKESDMTELYEDLISNKVKSKMDKIRKLVRENVKSKINKPKSSSNNISKKKKVIKENKMISRPKNITKQSLHSLLESVGIKSKRIKDGLIEKAEMMSGDIEDTYNTLERMVSRKMTPENESNMKTLLKYQEIRKGD